MGHVRHIIKYNSLEGLIGKMKYAVCSRCTNGIYASMEEIYWFANDIVPSFPNLSFKHTNDFVRDILDRDEQLYLIEQEHKRAHRNFNENYKQLQRKCFFPNMKKDTQNYAKNCQICKVNKYERHPKKQEIGKTPIPTLVN